MKVREDFGNTYRLHNSVFSRTSSETLGPEYPLIVLSFEGTVTEMQYFCGLKKAIKNRQYKYPAIYTLLPLRKTDTNSDPSSVIDLLDEYIKREPRGHSEAIYAAIIDKDNNNLSSSIDRCRESEPQYQLFITNPCFEFFLLLHLQENVHLRSALSQIEQNNCISTSHTYISSLISDLTHRDKTVNFKRDYLNNIDLALKNAQHFEMQVHRLQTQLGSNLPYLFEIIHGVRTSVWE